MSVFPGAIPAAGSANPNDTLAFAGHTALHNLASDEIRAIATKIGTGSSTPTSGTVLKGNGTGTSTWAQVDLATDVTGLLPSTSLANVYPVGCVYIETTGVNPNTTFGFGTWTAFGTGRTIVGIDSGQTEFNTVEETGGSKTHTLTTAEMPAHTHDVKERGDGTGVFTALNSNSGGWAGSTIAGGATTTGGGGSHNNLQPYIVVHMWKRTA